MDVISETAASRSSPSPAGLAFERRAAVDGGLAVLLDLEPAWAGSLPFWLSDQAWALIEPQMPRGKPGRPRVDDRRIISGILYVLRTGCRWRDAPPAYGPPTTLFNRYDRWSRRRLWRRLFETIAADEAVVRELGFDDAPAKARRPPRRVRSDPELRLQDVVDSLRVRLAA